MDIEWPDFRKLVKRRYSKRVWIPLGLSRSRQLGKYGASSYRSEYEGVHCLVVSETKRHLGEEYGWSDNNEHRPWAKKGFYKSSDIHWKNTNEVVGFRLALRQPFNDRSVVWHLHQDFVIALGLALEEDVWVRPAESYDSVARYVRDEKGEICGIEAKAEYLRDYLCARESALRISSFRDVDFIVEENEIPKQFEEGVEEEYENGRLEFRAMRIDSSGNPAGSGVAVFRASRNDVDPEDDVPEMGPETNDNIDGSSWTFNRGDSGKLRLMADFWRDEWLEPAEASVRVRFDEVPSQVTYIVSADGERMSADELNDEDIGRWLWFKPGIVPSIMARRGAALKWYSRDTGGISTPSDPAVHFGINEIGLVTVYARDVARLPEWERRLWAGFNTTPDGKVSAELLLSQVRAQPASTKAPEGYLSIFLSQFNDAWHSRFGKFILHDHVQLDEILERCHRFRAIDQQGLFSLAKDLARLTADLIDTKEAQKVFAPPHGQSFGSLKSLEKALGTICDPEFARKITGPLFATYELRLSDAHLPKSDILEAFQILGIDETDPPLVAAFKMINMVVASLDACGRILRQH